MSYLPAPITNNNNEKCPFTFDSFLEIVVGLKVQVLHIWLGPCPAKTSFAIPSRLELDGTEEGRKEGRTLTPYFFPSSFLLTRALLFRRGRAVLAVAAAWSGFLPRCIT